MEAEPYEISPDAFGRAAHLIETYALPMARRAYADAALSKSERAAIREFDREQSRKDAERSAAREIGLPLADIKQIQERG